MMTILVRRTALALLTTAVVLLLPAGAGAEPGRWQENDQSRVRLVSPWAEAPASGELILGLEVEVIPGWHVYWKNSGDAGYPPAISFAPTPEVTASEILWPAPQRYELPGDLVALGYEAHVVYPLRLEIDAVGLDGLTLAADLDYLVCEIDCVPYSYRLTLDQPLAAPGAAPRRDPPRAALVEHWLDRVPRPVERVAGMGSDGVLDLTDPDHPRLTVTLTGAGPAPGAEPALFLETHELFDSDGAQWETAVDGSLRFDVPLTYRQRPDAPPATAEFAWTVTGLVPAGSDAAVPVEARRSVAVRGAPVADQPAAPAPVRRPVPAALLLLGLLAGGLLLHLTPTVLPLTTVRLGEVAGGGPAARRDALSTAAGLGAGGLAAGLSGPLLGRTAWGFHLQEPVWLAALCLTAALTALDLWGVLRLVPARRGVARGLVAGVVAALLGLGWNVPFLGRCFGPVWAADAGSALAVGAAGVFALGLAAPFLLAAAVPALTRFFVRLAATGSGERSAGAEALAFLELAGLVWLLYLLSAQVTGAGLAFIQVTLLLAALAAWLLGSARRRGWALLGAVLLLLASLGVLGLADAHRRAENGRSGTDPAFTKTADFAVSTLDNPDSSSRRSGGTRP